MSYMPSPIKTEGQTKKVVVADDNLYSLMNQVLKELKKMNIHLELITEENVKNTEVD